MRNSQKFLLLSFVVAAAVSMAQTKQIAEQVYTEKVASTTAEAAKPVPPKDSLNQWINKLAYYESGNRADIKVLDVNNKYSYGCLQFQMATWLGMGKKYGYATTPENIYDCRLQKQLAHKMLTADRSNWHHWGYTVNVRMKVWPPRYPQAS